MGDIRKEKNLFIITLDNGKETFFDFSNGLIYGVSGKAISAFSNDARKVLRKHYSNFLAWYLYNRTLSNASLSFPYSLSHWSYSLIETIYSIFSNEYDLKTLIMIADFCYSNDLTLNKKTVKTLKQALTLLENTNIRSSSFGRDYFQASFGRAYFQASVGRNLSSSIYDIYTRASSEIQRVIRNDIDKIIYYENHENWTSLTSRVESDALITYINLCELLHKERTYKNLYLSVCQLKREKELLNEKLCKDYQEKASLFFEDENFIVKIPTTAEEFKEEADYQGNCVFRLYYPQVIDQKTHIVFIRKKNNIDVPYITCEVGNDGKIYQYLTRFNARVIDHNAIVFKEKYQDFLKNHF